MTKLLAAIPAAFLFVAPAAAQPACGPLETALEVFRAQHGEVPYVTMRDAGGNRLIVLANPETRSWSLLVLPSTSDAVACLVATGQDIAPVSKEKGRSS
jgi:hypothetical protein